MKDLKDKSVVILGFGVEGQSTFNVLKKLFPDKTDIAIADKNIIKKIPANIKTYFGENYLNSVSEYDIIIKAPGIPLDGLPVKKLNSQTQAFLKAAANKTIGVTGTKGKGTTAKLIHTILIQNPVFKDLLLVGNIGTPAYEAYINNESASQFVYELSAQQLETASISPHIAIALDTVIDHMDHFHTFERYLAAKERITIFQNNNDYFIYNIDLKNPKLFAKKTAAKLITVSLTSDEVEVFCKNGQIFAPGFYNGEITTVEHIKKTLPGKFNLNNVLPAIAATLLAGANPEEINSGIAAFVGQLYRFDKIYVKEKDITFYNAPISTVPEVTIAHLETLKGEVDTVILGGIDRGSDYSILAEYLCKNKIQNLILFPSTGQKIKDLIIQLNYKYPSYNPTLYEIQSNTPEESTKKAVEIAFKLTGPGKSCLYSPAAASFGLFANYIHRGSLFEAAIKEYLS